MDALSRGLTRLLSTEAPDRRPEVLSVRPLTGGYSRVMSRATVRWDGTEEQDVILRSDPDSSEVVYMTSRITEWKLLRVLTAARAVPMPAALYYDDGTHLGTETIVLDCCPGSSLHAAAQADGADLAGHALAVADALAAIHLTDLSLVEGVLETPASWDDYLSDLTGEWSRAERAHPESVPVLRYLGAWLSAHRPAPLGLGLVHGDFQTANIMVHGDLQVIDWEFAHIGDPREDLGWFNLYSASTSGPNLYALDPEAFLERYRARTGTSADTVNQATVTYFSVIAATRVYLDILRAAGSMAEGRAQGVMLTYNLNAVALGNFNWLSTCQALEGML
ncbi:MAG TPA: phosphotransferase family protein [Acidimicrobiales bacterium]|nr:phosphotransferase family protein [Acidimicrobiales bacterium]